MMMSMFSSFDPASSIFSIPLNWSASFLGLFILPYLYWAAPSRWTILWLTLLNSLHKEFKTLLGPKNVGLTLFMVSLFSMILFNNVLGLLPYVFTSTTHPAFTLSLALPVWISIMLFGWIKHTKHMLAHLVPMGTPWALMPFMVLIESISNVIRPGTLAVRLCANMIAGHLLISLLSSTGQSIQSSLTLLLLLFSQALLILLELAVAFIQSYVFAVLSSLYAGEIS